MIPTPTYNALFPGSPAFSAAVWGRLAAPVRRISVLPSPNRDGGLDIHIALDCIRVGTDSVGALDKLHGRFLANAGDGHPECSVQHEGARVVAAEADLGDHFDVAIGEMVASLTADAQEGILKARGITTSEELLRVGGVAFTSERSGHGQLKIEQAVVAANGPVTSSGGGDFC
jgi:hypothetical protein